MSSSASDLRTLPDPLSRVRKAANAKRRCKQEYQAAALAARAAGFSYAEIGRAAGISRQAARKLAGL